MRANRPRDAKGEIFPWPSCTGRIEKTEEDAESFPVDEKGNEIRCPSCKGVKGVDEWHILSIRVIGRRSYRITWECTYCGDTVITREYMEV